jgi:hypothetical protein
MSDMSRRHSDTSRQCKSLYSRADRCSVACLTPPSQGELDATVDLPRLARPKGCVASRRHSFADRPARLVKAPRAAADGRRTPLLRHRLSKSEHHDSRLSGPRTEHVLRLRARAVMVRHLGAEMRLQRGQVDRYVHKSRQETVGRSDRLRFDEASTVPYLDNGENWILSLRLKHSI